MSLVKVDLIYTWRVIYRVGCCFFAYFSSFLCFVILSPGSLSKVLINVSEEALFPKESSFEFNNG